MILRVHVDLIFDFNGFAIHNDRNIVGFLLSILLFFLFARMSRLTRTTLALCVALFRSVFSFAVLRHSFLSIFTVCIFASFLLHSENLISIRWRPCCGWLMSETVGRNVVSWIVGHDTREGMR